MKKLRVRIDEERNAQVVLTVQMPSQQSQLYLGSFDQLKEVYQKDLHSSIQSSLDVKQINNSELVKDDESKTVSYTFQWAKCVEKIDHTYMFHLKKVSSARKISRGIGLLDRLEIQLPQSVSLVSVQPKPSQISENTLVWKNFDWSGDLKVDFKE